MNREAGNPGQPQRRHRAVRTRVGAGRTQARHETGEPALGNRAPDTENANRPHRCHDGKADEQTFRKSDRLMGDGSSSLNTLRSGLSLKFVTDAAHSEDVTGVGGVVLDFCAQMADIDIHRALPANVAVVAPDCFDERRTADRSVGVDGQVVKQAKFGGGEVSISPALRTVTHPDTNLQIAEAQSVGFAVGSQFAIGPAQQHEYGE